MIVERCYQTTDIRYYGCAKRSEDGLEMWRHVADTREEAEQYVKEFKKHNSTIPERSEYTYEIIKETKITTTKKEVCEI